MAKPCLTDADKLFPQFIIIGLPVGVSGLVVAGLLACAMSAFSAGINSTCSVITIDIVDRLRGEPEDGRLGTRPAAEVRLRAGRRNRGLA